MPGLLGSVVLASVLQGPGVPADRVVPLGRVAARTTVPFQVDLGASQVVSMTPDCGCLHLRASSVKDAAGTRTVMVGELDTGPSEGHLSKRVVVVVGDQDRRSMTVVIEAEVRSFVRTDPPVLRLAELDATEPTQVVLNLLRERPCEVVLQPESWPSGIRCHLFEPHPPAPMQLVITFDPAALGSAGGLGHHDLRLRTSLMEQPWLVVPLTWSLEERFRVEPALITLRSASSPAFVTIHDRRGRPFHIVRSILPESHVRLRIVNDQTPGRVELELTPTGLPVEEAMNLHMELHTDLPDAKKVYLKAVILP